MHDSESVKVVAMLWKNPRGGQKMKKRYEQEMGLHEAFLEAVPTCFVITILLTSAISKFYEENSKSFSVEKYPPFYLCELFRFWW